MTLALFSIGKTARIVHGDSAEVLRALADNSVDSVITDPPAGIGFMGREWDSDKGGRDAWIAWLAGILRECLRVLKPGGHALVWALPKRGHWTGIAVEDAGFEVRDVHHHIFGTGMPKSHHELKPAVEHWILGRKPIRGSITACVAAHGTGSLQIEACRIEGAPDAPGTTPATANGNGKTMGKRTRTPYVVPEGRWPAHLSLDDAAAAELDVQAGERSSGGYPPEGGQRTQNATYGKPSAKGPQKFLGSTGGASRFFYVAKADEADKTEGGAVENDHETVKSTTLMRWLVRLVTPPGGIVLDPFAGSGTTGVACAAEGLSFIGVEQNAKHHETARRRLERSYGAVGVTP